VFSTSNNNNIDSNILEIMKLKYEDSILEKIVDTIYYDTNLWKVWAAVRYDIPLFFKNIWRFRKELYQHQWWDYHFTLQMMYRSLSIMVVKLEKDGIEIDSHRLKKVNAIKRALTILKSKIDGDYIERAELKYGEIHSRPFQFKPIENSNSFRMVDDDTPAEKKHRTKIYAYANKLEEDEWKELWKIFEGQDIKQFSKLLKLKTKEEQRNNDVWGEWFDGSGMRSWWD
jgi:hypothetical protein